MIRIVPAPVLVAALLLLSACGQSGRLYLPDRTPEPMPSDAAVEAAPAPVQDEAPTDSAPASDDPDKPKSNPNADSAPSP